MSFKCLVLAGRGADFYSTCFGLERKVCHVIVSKDGKDVLLYSFRFTSLGSRLLTGLFMGSVWGPAFHVCGFSYAKPVIHIYETV